MTQTNNQPLQIREKTITDGILGKYILKYIFKILFRLTGWTAGPAPQTSGVTIGAPHTSNWDFIYGIGAAIILDVKAYFSIKDSWCRIPVVGSFIMYLGAIPIDRSTPGKGQVEQISGFAQRMNYRWIYFAFTPEGTRSKVTKWKTGFYHVADDSGLPLHLCKLDYLNKVAGVFHTFELTGDKDRDVGVIQEAYKLIHGHNPDKQYPDYSGPAPEISGEQAEIMKVLYQQNTEITVDKLAEAMSNSELSQSIIDDLVEKAILSKVHTDSHTVYQLSNKGKGCLLHLFTAL